MGCPAAREGAGTPLSVRAETGPRPAVPCRARVHCRHPCAGSRGPRLAHGRRWCQGPAPPPALCDQPSPARAPQPTPPCPHSAPALRAVPPGLRPPGRPPHPVPPPWRSGSGSHPVLLTPFLGFLPSFLRHTRCQNELQRPPLRPPSLLPTTPQPGPVTCWSPNRHSLPVAEGGRRS